MVEALQYRAGTGKKSEYKTNCIEVMRIQLFFSGGKIFYDVPLCCQ